MSVDYTMSGNQYEEINLRNDVLHMVFILISFTPIILVSVYLTSCHLYIKIKYLTTYNLSSEKLVENKNVP